MFLIFLCILGLLAADPDLACASVQPRSFCQSDSTCWALYRIAGSVVYHPVGRRSTKMAPLACAEAHGVRSLGEEKNTTPTASKANAEPVAVPTNPSISRRFVGGVVRSGAWFSVPWAVSEWKDRIGRSLAGMTGKPICTVPAQCLRRGILYQLKGNADLAQAFFKQADWLNRATKPTGTIPVAPEYLAGEAVRTNRIRVAMYLFATGESLWGGFAATAELLLKVGLVSTDPRQWSELTNCFRTSSREVALQCLAAVARGLTNDF